MPPNRVRGSMAPRYFSLPDRRVFLADRRDLTVVSISAIRWSFLIALYILTEIIVIITCHDYIKALAGYWLNKNWSWKIDISGIS